MTSAQLLGFLFVVLGAVCGGSFGLPSKFVKKETPWEVLWGPFFFFVTILIPCVVAPLVVQDLGGIYARAGAATIVPVLVFGFLWGLGSMTLGMSFAFIGLSLAYALNYGAQIIFGSMIPLALFNAEHILTSHGTMILAGVCVCVAGVVAAGRAGMLKERSLKPGAAEPEPADDAGSAIKSPAMLVGIVVGVMSGILCACYAVASAYAGPIGAEGVKDNPQWAAAWAVTAMILWGGAVSACLYCAFQLTRKKTWGHLTRPGVGLVLALAAVMAVLHDAAIFFFGLGWIYLGELGVAVGYPVFMSFAIIVGNVHGFRTGEWSGASRRSILWIVAGIALLIAGVGLLAQGLAMVT
jgi:L-rhamnose-H+ transport protein